MQVQNYLHDSSTAFCILEGRTLHVQTTGMRNNISPATAHFSFASVAQM